MTCVTQCAEEFQEITPSGRVVLDLTNVRLVNRGFISVIVDFNRAAREHDGRLVLCNVGPEVLGLMALLHLTKLFTICESLDAAKAAAGG